MDPAQEYNFCGYAGTYEDGSTVYIIRVAVELYYTTPYFVHVSLSLVPTPPLTVEKILFFGGEVRSTISGVHSNFTMCEMDPNTMGYNGSVSITPYIEEGTEEED